jgi:hypothetical protein
MIMAKKKPLLTKGRVSSGCIGLLLASLVALALGRDGKGDTHVRLSATVARLVDDTTRTDSEAPAFLALQGLGDDAVPFIVSHLGDLRALPNPQISFQNRSPNAREARTHYGAEVVHDALEAILRQMTDQDIGAFDAERQSSERPALRRKNQEQWLKWCRARYPVRAADCGRE